MRQALEQDQKMCYTGESTLALTDNIVPSLYIA